MIRVLALLAALVAAVPAQAHKLKVFATAEGATIIGTAYFSGGDKARGVAGRVLLPDGTLAGEFRTGDDGGFRIEAVAHADHTISVDAGDGHVASMVVPAAELAASLPAGPTAPAVAAMPPATVAQVDLIEAAVARQIRPLREQLDGYEDKVRLHDILGGIGTIFGLFGVLAWVSAGKRRP